MQSCSGGWVEKPDGLLKIIVLLMPLWRNIHGHWKLDVKEEGLLGRLRMQLQLVWRDGGSFSTSNGFLLWLHTALSHWCCKWYICNGLITKVFSFFCFVLSNTFLFLFIFLQQSNINFLFSSGCLSYYCLCPLKLIKAFLG